MDDMVKANDRPIIMLDSPTDQLCMYECVSVCVCGVCLRSTCRRLWMPTFAKDVHHPSGRRRFAPCMPLRFRRQCKMPFAILSVRKYTFWSFLENRLTLFARSFYDKPIFRATSRSDDVFSGLCRMDSALYSVCVWMD